MFPSFDAGSRPVSTHPADRRNDKRHEPPGHRGVPLVCTENLIRVDDVMESPKLVE